MIVVADIVNEKEYVFVRGLEMMDYVHGPAPAPRRADPRKIS